MKLTLCSLNVQGHCDWDSREATLIDYFKQTQPDIALFQEVTFLPQLSTYNQVGIINKVLQYPYENSAVTRLQKSPHYENYREGLGILSKWPITKSETIILKQNPEDEHQRIVQLIDIMCDDTPVKIANVHFSISDNNENFPLDHLRELLEILDSRGETRIIGGDFNTTLLNECSHIWNQDYISTSTTPHITYPHMNKQIDYFLVPKAYKFLDISVSGDNLSDHRALAVAIADSPHIAAVANQQNYQTAAL